MTDPDDDTRFFAIIAGIILFVALAVAGMVVADMTPIQTDMLETG